jgi:hypothetical protein|tara:strand:+ start:452 stop:685 length:234 start_codon:yes stop_codon:yes gene_type:complete
MKLIWVMVMLMSSPNMPSVKYNALLYNTEDECMNSIASFLNHYENKSQEYKNKFVTNAFCLPFEAFPIKGLNQTGGA